MTMCMKLDMMKNHRGGGLISITDNFADQSDNGWICTRASQGLQAYPNNSQLGLFSANQMRFDIDKGVVVEKARTNQIPDNINYTTWIQVGGAISTESIPAFVTNQNVGVFTSDLSNGLHTFYCDALVNNMNEVSFYTLFDGTINSIRLGSQAFNFELFPDGSTNQPSYVRSKILNNGWIKWNIRLPNPGAVLFAIYLLGPGGAVSWQPSTIATLKFFGISGFTDKIEHTYFPVPGAVSASASKDTVSKAPYIGFDGNNFELIVSFRPMFNSSDSVSVGAITVFEWGTSGLDRVRLYYSISTNQFTFDRWANSLYSFVQCAPTPFIIGQELVLAIAQKNTDGIAISINGNSKILNSANAKAFSNLPTGDMYLGSSASGAEQINASIHYVTFIKL